MSSSGPEHGSHRESQRVYPQRLDIVSRLRSDTRPARFIPIERLAPVVSALASEQKSLLFANVVALADSYPAGFIGADFPRISDGMQVTPGEALSQDETWNPSRPVAIGWAIDNFVPAGLMQKMPADATHPDVWYRFAPQHELPEGQPTLYESFALAGTLLAVSERLEDVSLAEFFSLSDPSADKLATRRRIEITREIVRLWEEKRANRPGEEEISGESIYNSLNAIDSRWDAATVGEALRSLSALRLVDYRSRVKGGPRVEYMMPAFEELPQSPVTNPQTSEEQLQADVFRVLVEHQGQYLSLRTLYDLLSKPQPGLTGNQNEKRLRQEAEQRKSSDDVEKYIAERLKNSGLGKIMHAWGQTGVAGIKQRGATGVTLSDYQFQRLFQVTRLISDFQNDNETARAAGVDKALSYIQTTNKDAIHQQEAAARTRELIIKAKELTKNHSAEHRARIQAEIVDIVAVTPNANVAKITTELLARPRQERIPASYSSFHTYTAALMNQGRITVSYPGRKGIGEYRLVVDNPQNAIYFTEAGRNVAPAYMEEFLQEGLKRGMIMTKDGFPLALFDRKINRFVLLTQDQQAMQNLGRALLNLQTTDGPVAFEQVGTQGFLLVRDEETRSEILRRNPARPLSKFDLKNPNVVTFAQAVKAAVNRAGLSVGLSVSDAEQQAQESVERITGIK